MVKVSVVGPKGHEEFVDLTPEEAEKLINETIDAAGQRYFVVDKETNQVLREIKLQEGHDIALIPVAQGG